MIYSKAHPHARCDVAGVCNLLKEGLDCHGKVIDHVVNNIEKYDHHLAVGETVTEENEDKNTIFQTEDPAFTKIFYCPADPWVENPADGVVDEKEGRYFSNGEFKMLHHQKEDKGHEDLPTRSREESKQIEEPVLSAKDEFSPLECGDEAGGGIITVDQDAGNNNNQAKGEADSSAGEKGACGEKEDADDHIAGGDAAADQRQHHRGFFYGEMLQGKRLINRFKVVEPETHDQSCGDQSSVAWEKAGGGQSGSSYCHRECAETMFTYYKEKICYQQSEETRNFPY